jgi:iron complex transport system substrate-binding protein
MRIVSLLPSITEIICELGLQHQLVGRSHECRQSEYIRSLPAITSPEIKTKADSSRIHSDVQELIENGLSVYKIDGERLRELQPDLIITQDHCEVCAASLSDVQQAVESFCTNNPDVVSVAPETLRDVFESVLTIGKAAQAGEAAKKLVDDLAIRFEIIRRTINGTLREETVTLEWLDPLMTGGNWIPELVEIAGGDSCLAEPGKHSPVIEWEKVIDANPDKLLIAPCGYTIHQTQKEMHLLTNRKGWQNLKAVKSGEVYLLDGDRFFNRPGPGIYDSARIIAEINHPDLFKPLYENDGWVRWE